LFRPSCIERRWPGLPPGKGRRQGRTNHLIIAQPPLLGNGASRQPPEKLLGFALFFRSSTRQAQKSFQFFSKKSLHFGKKCAIIVELTTAKQNMDG